MRAAGGGGVCVAVTVGGALEAAGCLTCRVLLETRSVCSMPRRVHIL